MRPEITPFAALRACHPRPNSTRLFFDGALSWYRAHFFVDTPDANRLLSVRDDVVLVHGNATGYCTGEFAARRLIDDFAWDVVDR